MAQARRSVIDKAVEPLSLILDVDTEIPNRFITEGSQKLVAGYLACSLRYSPDVQKHPAFGASFWVTQKLKQLYDYHVYVQNYKPIRQKIEDGKGNDCYKITNPFLCECRYMWAKLKSSELYVFKNLKVVHP
jgi:hypothetical protein